MLFPRAARPGHHPRQLSWNSVWDSVRDSCPGGVVGARTASGVTGAREQGLVPGASTKWALHIATSLDLLQALAGTRGLRELALASMVPRDLQLCVRWRAGHAVTSQYTV